MPAGNPDAGVQGAWAMAPVWWEHVGTNESEGIVYRGGDHGRLCRGNRERMDTLSAKDRKKEGSHRVYRWWFGVGTAHRARQ